MRRIAGLVLLLTFAATAAWSQTVIDLGPGGGVRSKTWKDYERDGRTPAQQLADSLAYRDCLTRAFNALATDSLAQADGLFREALKLMPGQSANPLVYYQLGLIASVRGDDRAVVAEMTHALDARPDMADARRMIDRVPNLGPDHEYRDACGCNAENFDYPINLMFSSSMPIWEGSFEAALDQTAADLRQKGLLR